MRLDGALGHEQPRGDGAVGHALGDEPQDFSFPVSEPGQRIGPAAKQAIELAIHICATLSRQTLDYTAGIIRRHRKQIGSRWRKLNPGRQALLVLAYLRKGETFGELAAGFGIGTATAWRCVTETVALLAARAPKLRRALAKAKDAGHAYLVIDGTLLLPLARRAAGQKPPTSCRPAKPEDEKAQHPLFRRHADVT